MGAQHRLAVSLQPTALTAGTKGSFRLRGHDFVDCREPQIVLLRMSRMVLIDPQDIRNTRKVLYGMGFQLGTNSQTNRNSQLE